MLWGTNEYGSWFQWLIDIDNKYCNSIVYIVFVSYDRLLLQYTYSHDRLYTHVQDISCTCVFGLCVFRKFANNVFFVRYVVGGVKESVGLLVS